MTKKVNDGGDEENGEDDDTRNEQFRKLLLNLLASPQVKRSVTLCMVNIMGFGRKPYCGFTRKNRYHSTRIFVRTPAYSTCTNTGIYSTFCQTWKNSQRGCWFCCRVGKWGWGYVACGKKLRPSSITTSNPPLPFFLSWGLPGMSCQQPEPALFICHRPLHLPSGTCFASFS